MKFRKKPIVIEAEQFWPDKPLPFRDRGPYVSFNAAGRWYVTTAHAQAVYLMPGDWIILESSSPRAIAFAAYPVKPDIFAATYEPIEVETEARP